MFGDRPTNIYSPEENKIKITISTETLVLASEYILVIKKYLIYWKKYCSHNVPENKEKL